MRERKRERERHHSTLLLQDGRLQQGDQLLQINEESVIHMRYDDVIAKLRSVSTAGYPVKLVVARKVSEEGTDDVDINDVHVSMSCVHAVVTQPVAKSANSYNLFHFGY